MIEDLKLERDEKLIWVKHPSKIILLASTVPVIIGIVALIFLFKFSSLNYPIIDIAIIILGILILGALILNYYQTKYILTTKKVATRIGILGSKFEEISFADVQAIDRIQTFWGMVFGYGDLIIEAAGTGNNVKFLHISKVNEIKKQISKYCNV